MQRKAPPKRGQGLGRTNPFYGAGQLRIPGDVRAEICPGALSKCDRTVELTHQVPHATDPFCVLERRDHP